jgi:hypothetical protein
MKEEAPLISCQLFKGAHDERLISKPAQGAVRAQDVGSGGFINCQKVFDKNKPIMDASILLLSPCQTSRVNRTANAISLVRDENDQLGSQSGRESVNSSFFKKNFRLGAAICRNRPGVSMSTEIQTSVSECQPGRTSGETA